MFSFIILYKNLMLFKSCLTFIFMFLQSSTFIIIICKGQEKRIKELADQNEAG